MVSVEFGIYIIFRGSGQSRSFFIEIKEIYIYIVFNVDISDA